MNIAQATEQIEGAVRAYLSRDERGLLRIPAEMQRPIIMMGPPGIGKTAIVSQIAERLGINFVSYSMTHHTRQSAIGLPYIAEARYGGQDYRVSRYTMSEIIAAAYDAVASSGVEEGVLFLDEVNCVSETLAPAMLQFLQFKTFGQHRLPAGWVIVCAGNPPEYNRSAREFDPATMDRLKRIDVEPDLDVWMDYATTHGVHPAITSYLANKPKNFYRVRATAVGAHMVTARGWEDLSRMLGAYEAVGLAADRELVGQYLQDAEIAEDFALYLELFAKYQDDYKVEAILAGTAGKDIVDRAERAPFDERIALVNLLVEALVEDTHAATATEAALRTLRGDLAGAREALEGAEFAKELEALVEGAANELDTALAKGTAASARQMQLAERAMAAKRVQEAVTRWSMGVDASNATTAYDAARAAFNDEASALAKRVGATASRIDAALSFLDQAFGAGQEMLVLVGRLSVDPEAMRFVAAHGPASFTEQARGLMFHERGLELLEEARDLANL